jgi:hypothetical protein
MSPDKALELVHRYSRLNRDLKDYTRRIGERLELCQGINGSRAPKHTPFGFQREDHPDHFDTKNRDKRMHLWRWYQPEICEDGDAAWEAITNDEHGAECCHCYEAHLLIQLRKAARKEFGQVKGAMSRSLP